MSEVEFSDTQLAFLERYLNFKPAVRAGSGDPESLAEPARPEELEDLGELADLGGLNPADLWIAARQSVSADIRVLQAELQSFEEPNLQRIARSGLDGVTSGNNVALVGALAAYNSAKDADRKAAAQKVAQRADEFRAFLRSDPIIALCENNPFGKNIRIVAPLDRALERICTMVGA